MLQKWIREKYFIHIQIGKDEEYWTYDLYEFKHGNKHIPKGRPQFHTYEETLEEALIQALKLIK